MIGFICYKNVSTVLKRFVVKIFNGQSINYSFFKQVRVFAFKK